MTGREYLRRWPLWHRGGGLPHDLPVIPNLDARILAAIETGPGGLEMRAWHSECGTTHCRAGWAVKLAGAPAEALEDVIGTERVGELLYALSYPDLSLPDFYATNEEALADMRRRAGRDQKTQAEREDGNA